MDRAFRQTFGDLISGRKCGGAVVSEGIGEIMEEGKKEGEERKRYAVGSE